MAVNIPQARLPRLLALENGVWHEERRLYPTAADLHLKLNGISQAGLTMDPADEELDMHAFVEIYTLKGSAGIYRVTSPSHRAGISGTYTLQHGIDTLNDCLWKAQLDFKGTAQAFLQGILACQNEVYWQLGTCEDSRQYKKTGINYDKAGDLLAEFISSRQGYYLDYDFTTWPWTLHWKALPLDVRAEWRAKRNVHSCSISQYDTDQCTRLYYTVSPAEGQEADPTVHVLNNTTAQARPGVGIIEKAITIDADVVANPAAEAQQYLADHEYPAVQITVDGYEYYRQTGDTLDRFDLGILTRCLVDGVGTISERLVGLVYSDLLGDGEHVTAEMANSLPRFSESILQASKAAARASRRASSAVSKAEEGIQQYQHYVTENEVYKQSVYKIVGVKLDEHGNVIYKQATDQQGNPIYDQQGNPVYETDAAGNPVPVFDPNATGSLSGTVTETAQNYTRIYEKTGINALGENETILTKVQQSAEQYAITAVQNNMSGYLQVNALLTELGNKLVTSDGKTIVSTIVTTINDDQGTIYLNSDHVKLKDGSVITATTLDARLANIDAITSNTIQVGTVVSSATGYFEDLWIQGSSGGQAFSAKVDQAVNSISEYTPQEEGKIGFKFTRLGNPNYEYVNFNIADTAYFQERVGINSLIVDVTDQAGYNDSSADTVSVAADGYYIIAAAPKHGNTIYKKFHVPAGTTTTPKVSKGSWSSGQIMISASSAASDPVSSTIKIKGGTATGSLDSATNPTKISFDVLEDLGSNQTDDTGVDIDAAVTRGPATVKLGTNNGSPAVVADTVGYVTVGGQRIQVGVTPLAVVPGAATPNTPTWISSTHKYAITADGSVAIGSASLALVQGSISGDFSPTHAFTYGFNLCFNSVTLKASKLELNPGETVDVIPNMKGTWDASQAQDFTGKKITISAKAATTVNVDKGSWSIGAIAFTTNPASGTGKNVSLGFTIPTNTSNGNVQITVVDKASPGSTSQPLSTGLAKTLTLTCGDDYATVTDGGTTVARVPNNKSATPVTVNVDKGSWSIGAIAFTTNPASGTGKNVSLDFTIPANTSNGNVQITVVDKASPGSASQPITTGLTKTLTLTCGDDYATVTDGGTTVARVPNNKSATISASIDSIGLRNAGGVQYVYDPDDKEYAVYVRATGTNVAQKDGTVYISASEAFIAGRDSVTITNVERVASCSFDVDRQTARQDVRFTLSNGNTFVIHENFDAVYRAGLAGTSVDTTIEYAADLSSDGAVFDTVEEDTDGDPLRINVSDIYQRGVSDATPGEKHWYVTGSGDTVPIYVFVPILSEGFFIQSTKVAFYTYTPVEIVSVLSGNLAGYTKVSYSGSEYVVLSSSLTESERDLSIGHRIGIKNLEEVITVTSTTMTGLIHTGGCTSNISVYLEPYEGDNKNYTSTYVSSSDYSSYRTNGNVTSYLGEMATMADYYGRHEKTDFASEIQHKAIFEILYSNGDTEEVVVSFKSYAKAQDEVIYDKTGYIDANNYVNLRSTNSTGGSILIQVPDGAAVMCKFNPNGYSDPWMPVQYGGKTGYIQSQFIEGTDAWTALNTKKVSTIKLVGVGHAIGSSKKDFGVIVQTAKDNSSRMAISYAIESGEYASDWRVTNNDIETYLKKVKQGYYLYHSKADCSSTILMRVKMNVTYTNRTKFPDETVVVSVQSLAT